MITFQPLFGRIMVAAMFIVMGVTFLIFGLTIFPPVILLSIISFVFAPIYFWRAGCLGVEIQNGTLIVRSYFQRHDTFVPLANLLLVFRGACDDATVLQFSDRQFILDDSYFSDLKTRDAIFQSLQSYAQRDVA